MLLAWEKNSRCSYTYCLPKAAETSSWIFECSARNIFLCNIDTRSAWPAATCFAVCQTTVVGLTPCRRHPPEPACSTASISWTQHNMRSRLPLGMCLLQKTRCISRGSSVGGNMLTAKSAWSTAAPSKAVLIPALQNVHRQVATVPRKDMPGGKKLAESTGAIEKNNDNKNVRNGIMKMLWL